MSTHGPHGRAHCTRGHIPETHTEKGTRWKVRRGRSTNHVHGTHTHTPRPTRTRARPRHSVPGKDKDTVSPHPHVTTHKHADRYTHTGGCCVAPTSTCGVFSFCLFWGRKTDRFSSPPPLGPASPTATSRSPGRGTESPRCLLPSVHAQPSTLQGTGLGSLLCANILI